MARLSQEQQAKHDADLAEKQKEGAQIAKALRTLLPGEFWQVETYPSTGKVVVVAELSRSAFMNPARKALGADPVKLKTSNANKGNSFIFKVESVNKEALLAAAAEKELAGPGKAEAARESRVNATGAYIQ